MAEAELAEWLDVVCTPEAALCVKRLSGNDTLASGAHQAGPYLPKDFLLRILPRLYQPLVKNPDHWFDLTVDSHLDRRKIRAVWYNSRRSEGLAHGRDETRLTNFGGGASSLLDPENTGALAVLAFPLDAAGAATACRVWLCRDETEEEMAEARFGPVEPGRLFLWSPDRPGLFPPHASGPARCMFSSEAILPEWRGGFPTGAEIIRRTVELRPEPGVSPDRRLLRRRDCEYDLFRSIEAAVELPAIREGFAGLEAFIARAQTVLQRRKARSGLSLELHLRAILLEEGFREGIDFEHGSQSEPGRRPDFLFPSQVAYRDPAFPAERLRMLATKTTCRDRWRQILNEADRIPVKHMLTLQEGVSEAQFREMTEAGVRLVVPAPLIEKFPRAIRSRILSLEGFLAEMRGLSLPQE